MRAVKAALATSAGAAFLFNSYPALSQAPVEERAQQELVPVSTPEQEAAPSEDNALKILLELQSLTEELAYLRGRVEELEYQLQRVEGKQSENYSDLDGRVRSLYAGEIPEAPRSTDTPVTDNPIQVAGPVVQEQTNSSAESASLYQQGFNALRTGDRDQAVASFESLVSQYPAALEVADAYYWLGETYWLANKREESRQAFVQLLEHSPNYRKANDARYRLGVIYALLGDEESATAYMTEVAQSNSSQSIAAQAWLTENQAPVISEEVNSEVPLSSESEVN